MNNHEYTAVNDIYVRSDCVKQFEAAGLSSMDSVFLFSQGNVLSKANIAKFRSRIQFELCDGRTIFLKRYNGPPMRAQISNWISHSKIGSTMLFDVETAQKLMTYGINTPEVLAYGQQQDFLFERRSFVVLDKIPGEALERKLPDCLVNKPAAFSERNNFVVKLALFARKFHDTGYRHRDFYLAHIFYDGTQLYIIDLQRAIKPRFFAKRYLIKDLAQLHFSAPGGIVSSCDRMRFILCYLGMRKLDCSGKSFVRAIIAKALRMAGHDQKHGRVVPFLHK